MDLKFNLAESSHLESIVRLLADDPLGEKRERFKTPLPRAYFKALDNILNAPNQELMIVTLADEVVGTFQLSFIQYLTYQGGIRAQLEGVRVSKNFRDKGIGAEILEFCIARSKQKKAHLLQLTTDKARPDAIRFYKSFGFVASHEGMKLHF